MISILNCLKYKDNCTVLGCRPRGADQFLHSRNAISGLSAPPDNAKLQNIFTVSISLLLTPSKKIEEN